MLTERRFGVTCNGEDPELQLKITNAVERELLLFDFRYHIYFS